MLIARLIEPATLSESLDRAKTAMDAAGLRLASAAMLEHCSEVLQIGLPEGDAGILREILDTHFAPLHLLIADHEPVVPRVFVGHGFDDDLGQDPTSSPTSPGSSTRSPRSPSAR